MQRGTASRCCKRKPGMLPRRPRRMRQRNSRVREASHRRPRSATNVLRSPPTLPPRAPTAVIHMVQVQPPAEGAYALRARKELMEADRSALNVDRIWEKD